MNFDRASVWYFVAFILIGAILGAAIGALIVRIFPALSIITANLTGPIGFNLEIISFSLNINLSAIVGILCGFLLFKKV